MSLHPSKIVHFSKCYSQSVNIQISIPAISSTTKSVSELTIIRVWLPVKEVSAILFFAAIMKMAEFEVARNRF